MGKDNEEDTGYQATVGIFSVPLGGSTNRGDPNAEGRLEAAEGTLEAGTRAALPCSERQRSSYRGLRRTKEEWEAKEKARRSRLDRSKDTRSNSSIPIAFGGSKNNGRPKAKEKLAGAIGTAANAPCFQSPWQRGSNRTKKEWEGKQMAQSATMTETFVTNQYAAAPEPEPVAPNSSKCSADDDYGLLRKLELPNNSDFKTRDEWLIAALQAAYEAGQKSMQQQAKLQIKNAPQSNKTKQEETLEKMHNEKMKEDFVPVEEKMIELAPLTEDEPNDPYCNIPQQQKLRLQANRSCTDATTTTMSTRAPAQKEIDNLDEEDMTRLGKMLSMTTKCSSSQPITSSEGGSAALPSIARSEDQPAISREQEERTDTLFGSDREEEESATTRRSEVLDPSSSSLPIVTEVEAEVVDSDYLDQMRSDIRRELLREATAVSVRDLEGLLNKSRRLQNLGTFTCCCILIIVVCSTVIGLSVGLTQQRRQQDHYDNIDINVDINDTTAATAATMAPSIDNRPTLEIVQERGYLRCGTNNNTFPIYNESGTFKGFNVDQCRTLALLALGDPDKYEIVWTLWGSKFELLTTGDVDVLAEGTTITMGRDVYETPQTSKPYTFSQPYYYAGLAFGGLPPFVECADNLDSFNGECRSLKICVVGPSTNTYVLEKILRSGVIVVVVDFNELRVEVTSGACQVVASDSNSLSFVKPWFSEWAMGSRFSSKEPLALMTRQDDPAWSALANSVVNFFFLAEAQNISKQEAKIMDDIRRSRGNANDTSFSMTDMYASVISEFGHYGDLYLSRVEEFVPRDNLNSVYDKSQSTGLFYTLPFGRLEGKGPGPVPNGTLENIMNRGHLICGVQPSRGPGFARLSDMGGRIGWGGFDVAFCQGLAASIFVGDRSKVSFLELQDMNHSYHALVSDLVDVVAGARVTMQASYNEPQTGRGYSFSTIYYYDNDSLDGYAFMSRKDDPQWSDFIYWMPMALFYAEERGISFVNAAEMPVIELFGEGFKQMFMDSIFALSNYAEVYSKNLQDFIPRSGANMLHQTVKGPLQYPIPLE